MLCMFKVLEKGIRAGETQGAEYTELRAENVSLTSIAYSNGRVDILNSLDQFGVACRVLYSGSWGFACGTVDNVESLVDKACSLARAASRVRKRKTELMEIRAHEDEIKNQFREPPSDVSVEKKISRLDRLCTLIKDQDKRIRTVSLKYKDSHGFKYLMTSEGTHITQEGGYVWNSCLVTGKDNGIMTSVRDRVGSTHQGFEYFETETEEIIARRIGRRLILQMEGKNPKKGTFPCVLGSRVVGVLAHEALGHLAEADFTPNSSFNGRLGEQVAPELVSMVDAPTSGGFGTSKYDDEGILMKKVDIIKDGVLTGFLTNREYSWRMDLPVCGAARAENFLFPPIIRMRNTYFDKGDYTDEELFEDIDFGYYCVDYHGEQAQLNSSFWIKTQEAFEIHNGEIGNPVKNLAIHGVATETLFSIEGIGKVLGFGESFCGKGQSAAVSSGGPHMRVGKGGIHIGGR